MVAFFFALSGFFMVMPLKGDGEERFTSVKGWRDFYLLRAIRIIPLYWGILILYFWYSEGRELFSKSFWYNILFINCEGHLWFLQQELLCYLFVPVILLFIHLLKRYIHISNGKVFILLLSAGVLTEYYLCYYSSFRLVSGDARYFRLGNMMMGMALGYLYKSNVLSCVKTKIFTLFKDSVSILILLLSYFSSAYFLSLIWPDLSQYFIGWAYPGLMVLMWAILIYLVASMPEGLVASFFSNKWFVKGGQVSYGIYIIHWYILFMVNAKNSLSHFCITVLLTLAVSITYFEKIEEPLVMFVRSKIQAIR